MAYQRPRINRLKSPPPPVLTMRNTLQRTASPRRIEQDNSLANTSSKRQPVSANDADKGEFPDDAPRSTPRLSRGPSAGGSTLETVQEGGIPSVTTTDHEDGAESKQGSGSEGSRSPVKVDPKQRLAVNPKTDEVVPKRSFTSLGSARGKLGEASMTNMTVETETVSSIPQVSVGGYTGDRGGPGRKESGGSVRLRPSDETIRPKKEKKKTTRKAAIPPGTVSSKADIFEAKVASAVDDADSSDSGETFVYESNPPDPHPSRQHRYHSRTPSATSMASQMEYGGRARTGLREGIHGIIGKRSMKFTNTSYPMDAEGEGRNGGSGSSRTNGHMRTTRHYHIGRHGRNGHQLAFEQSQSSEPPRRFVGNGHRNHGTFKKDGDTYGYDFDAEGADDERTPLVSGSRGSRNRYGRRSNGVSLRQMEYLEQRQRGTLARYSICGLLLLLMVVLIGGATTFVIGVSKTLGDVHVREIQNVLASEQELMLDLDVMAINANLFAITVNDMDVSIFAKSRYVGSEAFWRDRGPHPETLPRTKESRARKARARAVRRAQENPRNDAVNITGGVDRGTDPIPDDDLNGDPQTMLLGRIFQFASPLTFDPSPWKHQSFNSTGQVRLVKPGNKTEEGGSLRWERVLQHPFELIVRGVVKYQLPLNSRIRSASISSKVNVLPNNDTTVDDGYGNPDNLEPGDSMHIEN